LHLNLATETRTNVKAVAVYGVLPGATGENILAIAHFDGFWEATVDNASAVAAMLGLAEYYSKTGEPDAISSRTGQALDATLASRPCRWIPSDRYQRPLHSLLQFVVRVRPSSSLPIPRLPAN
jgi:hypothetical protein